MWSQILTCQISALSVSRSYLIVVTGAFVLFCSLEIFSLEFVNLTGGYVALLFCCEFKQPTKMRVRFRKVGLK